MRIRQLWFLLLAVLFGQNLFGQERYRIHQQYLDDLGYEYQRENLKLVARVAFPGRRLGDIWGEGNLVVTAGRKPDQGSIMVVDVSGPKLKVAALIDQGGFVQDVKLRNRLLFATNEQTSTAGYAPGGFRIYDLSNPGAPALIAFFTSPDIRSIHNLWPTEDGNYVYLVNTTRNDIRIIEVADPLHPREVGRFVPEAGIVHDMVVKGDRCYMAALPGGFYILDVSDPTNPRQLAHQEYRDDFTHNIWPTEDGKYVLTTDENLDGHIQIWDIQDLDNIRKVADYQHKENVIVHNVHVKGDYAYISYYVNGVHIVDISDPTRPSRVAHFDSFNGPDDQGFDGAWGVWPYHPKYVFASDLTGGLFILEPTIPLGGR